MIQVALSEDLKLLFFEHDQTSRLRTHISLGLHLQKISQLSLTDPANSAVTADVIFMSVSFWGQNLQL